MKRLLAIGDIHGCLEALDTLLEVVSPGRDDVLVTLGDYVDRGPDSKGVIERLMELQESTGLQPLLGNHDWMFLEGVTGRLSNVIGWLQVGGIATLESYGGRTKVNQEHLDFLQQCQLWHEPAQEPVFFVHGSVDPGLPLEKQDDDTLLWRRVTELKRPHQSGKTMICGHTAQHSGLPLYQPGAICIDTWAYGGGWLTCLDVSSGEVIQSNQKGELRRFSEDEMKAKVTAETA